MSPRIRVFRYIPDLDAFTVTDEYRDIAEDLGLAEWTPVVWIGRLFILDNDFGEHWFDNWDLRAERRADAEKLGYDADDLLFVDPDRFEDGRDGPCHTAEIRKQFWTDVLTSLELSVSLLFREARASQEGTRELLKDNPDAPDYQELLIPDLEARIARWTQHYGVEAERVGGLNAPSAGASGG